MQAMATVSIRKNLDECDRWLSELQLMQDEIMLFQQEVNFLNKVFASDENQRPVFTRLAQLLLRYRDKVEVMEAAVRQFEEEVLAGRISLADRTAKSIRLRRSGENLAQGFRRIKSAVKQYEKQVFSA